jgi:predicted esterase
VFLFYEEVAMADFFERADREKHHWKSARDLGWLVALAQSSQVGSLDSYVWDDLDLAYREISQHFNALQEKYTLDPGRIMLGGFSQGSAIALLSVLRGDLPATSFIAVAPGRMADMADFPALASSARGRGLHGVIVAGGKDPRFEIFTQISETLSAYGIPCQLESRAGLRHAYPSDFQEILEKTLSSVSHKEHE